MTYNTHFVAQKTKRERKKERQNSVSHRILISPLQNLVTGLDST